MKSTNNLIILCLFASFFSWFIGGKSIDFLAFSTSNILSGKFWTPITALFVHSDLIHLLGNIVFLYVFGNTLESEIGAAKMLIAFLFGGTSAFFLSIFFYPPNIPMIGASAAIFTLAAVSMLVKPLKTSLLFLFLPVGLVAILYFIFNFFQIYYGISSNVAYISHIMGFLIGIPLGIFWSKKWIKNLIITCLLLLIYLILAYWVIPLLLITYNIG